MFAAVSFFPKMNYEMTHQPPFTQIEKVIQLKDGIVILETQPGFPVTEVNLSRVGLNDEVQWKADKPGLRSLLTRIKLMAYSVRGAWPPEKSSVSKV